MEYRRLGKNDIELLVEMRLKYVAEDAGKLTDTQRETMINSLPGYFERHIDEDLFAFAAFDGELIVATAYLLIVEKPANPNFITGRTGTVLNVYTRERYRRRGIATQVMKMLLEHAGAEKLDFVELQATEAGYPLYRKLGFTEKESSYTSMKYSITQ